MGTGFLSFWVFMAGSRETYITKKSNFSSNNYNRILWLKLCKGGESMFQKIRSSPVERHWRHSLCTYAEYLPAVLIRDSFWFFLLLKIMCVCFFLSISVYFCKYITKHNPCSLTFWFQTPLCVVLYYLTAVMTFSISSCNCHLRGRQFVMSHHAYCQSFCSAVSS